MQSAVILDFEVEMLGMNDASKTIIDRLALHDKRDAVDNVGTH